MWVHITRQMTKRYRTLDGFDNFKSFYLREWGELGNEGRPILLKIGTHSYCEHLCNIPKFQLH